MYSLNGPSQVHPSFIHFAVMFANSRLIALSGKRLKQEKKLQNMSQCIIPFRDCSHVTKFSPIFSFLISAQYSV